MTDSQVPHPYDHARRMSFCAVVPLDKVSGAKQTADSVLLVTPKFFRHNLETASDNKFATTVKEEALEELSRQAFEQHARFVQRLRDAGVEVVLIEAHDEDVRNRRRGFLCDNV